jgi:tetratricopeptide (TPR) repeat protein
MRHPPKVKIVNEALPTFTQKEMKSRIIFLPVPEQLKSMEPDVFYIDPDIPIPIEISGGDTDSIDNISIESILSAMLRVIEEGGVRREWIDYYSNFVLFLRPDIPSKLKEMNDVLADEDYSKALKLTEEGKAEEGLAHIRAFIERHPLVYNGWFILGWALRLLGRWQAAQAALKKSIELGGGNGDTRNELAICLMETGDAAGAKRELEAALYNDPENVKIISNLGALALKTGDKEKAAAFFRTALEIDPNDPVAKEYLENLIPE